MDSMLSLIRLLLVPVVISLTACGGGSSSGGSGNTVKSAAISSSLGVSSASPVVISSALSSSSASQVASSIAPSSSRSSLAAVGKINVTIVVAGSGWVGITGVQQRELGQQLVIPITPDEGFRIASVAGCPGSYTLNGYLTDALTADCSLTVNFEVDVVEPIADPALKKLVKEALGLTETDALTARKMWLLEQVYPIKLDDSTNMIEIKGIEYAKNLNYFRIPNLMESKVANTRIFDLSPLAQLENLESLVISNIHINDLSSLQNLKKLNFLMIEGSDLKDISALSGLQKLKVINLGFNNISDISVLKEFDNLRGLSLGGNQLDSNKLAVLKGKSINLLSLEFTPVESLEFLRGNSVLEGLSIDGTLVNSLEPLLDTGLGQGSTVYASSTCLVYSNNKRLRETLKTFVAKGVSVEQTPIDFAYENEGNPIKLVDKCPARDVQISASINAKYNANGSLDIDWNLTGDLAGRVLNCAIYSDIELQQSREPLVNIDSCPSIGSKIINGFSHTNEDLRFVLSDGFGAHKEILVTPTSSASSGPVIQSIDWGQSVISANPRLVQNRDALLRVHVVATTPAPTPEITVELQVNGQSTIVAMQKPAQLPSVKNYQSLSDSYLLTVPGNWVKPGLSLKIVLQGQEARILSPIVNEKTELHLTVVPIEIVGEVASIPSESDIQSTLRGFWPLSNVSTRIHPVFKSKVTTGEGMWSLLSEINELRALENDSSYYYGFFSSNLYGSLKDIPYGGIANVGGFGAVGLDRTDKNGYLTTWASTMLHEIGHTFSLNHVKCGNPYPFDYGYPYSVNTIGSLGVSADLESLYLPKPYDAGGYADIMSYCWPQHVSDYSFMKVQDYLELHPLKGFSSGTSSAKKKTADATENKSLYISGEISSSGVVTLRRIIPVQQLHDETVSGDYKIRVIGKNAEQFEQSFNVNLLDHATKSSPQFFAVKIPLIDLVSVEVFYKGRSIFKELDQLAKGGAQKQQLTVSIKPELHETGSTVCASWAIDQYKSASLLLQQEESASVVFMDDSSGKICASTVELPAGGDWHLVLRNNLRVEELTFAR